MVYLEVRDSALQGGIEGRVTMRVEMANQGAPANRRPAEQSERSGNVPATVAADRAFPAALAELTSEGIREAD